MRNLDLHLEEQESEVVAMQRTDDYRWDIVDDHLLLCADTCDALDRLEQELEMAFCFGLPPVVDGI